MNETTAGIAIIGIGCRFPEAETSEEFWKILAARRTVMRPTGQAGNRHPAFVDVHTPVHNIDRFDAAFFRMTPAEASLTDPQHRLFLECAYRALENAGYADSAAGRHIGVFGSTSMSTYLFNNILRNRSYGDGDNYQLLLGNDKDFLASRVSFKLDLRGPSLSVQSACSSSLVAVHLACISILSGESEMALAGGVSLTIPQASGHLHKAGGILSDQPSCRAFDARAAGTVKGNGCGVILLKPLAAAEADADRIIAVIKSTAVNNDGAEKATYMAPTVRGQASIIREALEVAGIDASEVDYVETHGTGTKLGDMVEVEALGAALSDHDGHVIQLGTLKPNIGHLDAAAGVAGVIKAALVLEKQAIPGAASFDTPNPDLDLEAKGFRVASSATPAAQDVRHAGVSSFGVGGTNAHIVMARPPRPNLPASERPELILLSAQSDAALRDLVDRTAAAIESAKHRLADVAYTLACRRAVRPYRISFVARDSDDLLAQMRRFSRGSEPRIAAAGTPGDALEVARMDLTSVSGLTTLAARWCAGAEADFTPLFASRRVRCLPLPGYGFDYRSCWIEPDVSPAPDGNAEGRSDPAALPARGTLETILRLCAHRLGVDNVQPAVDLAHQGGDSIMLVELLFDVQDRFGVVIPAARAVQLGCPAAIAQELDRRLAEAAAPPPPEQTAPRPRPNGEAGHPKAKLVCIVKGEPGRNIVLVHPAGGTISTFVDLCDSIDDGTYSVHGVPFPKSFTTEPGALSMDELARRYADAIEDTIGVDGLVLGGYSFGGNVAYEMSHIFSERHGRAPNLVLFDSHPPHAYGNAALSEDKLVETFALVVHSVLARTSGLPSAPEDLSERYRGRSLDAAVQELLESGVVPLGLRADDLTRFYRVWVANHYMLRAADRRDRAPVNALLFNVREPECPLILNNLGITPVEHGAWRDYIVGTLLVEDIPGDHYTAFSIPEHVAVAGRKFHDLLSDEWLWRPLDIHPRMESVR